MKKATMTPTVAGSCKSDWMTAVANSNATADASLVNPTASTAATRVPIPLGATGVLFRQRVSASGVTVGTLCIIQPVALDRNGVPTRLDTATLGATGLSLPLDSTLASNYIGANMSSVRIEDEPLGKGGDTSAYRYGTPVSLTGVDGLGGQWLYVLRSTASSHTGGAANPTVEVLFLN